MPTRSISRSVGSSGQPGSQDLLIPFFDVTRGAESSVNLSLAGSYAGRAREQFSNNLLGADVNASMRLGQGAGWRADGLGGFRYLRLHESHRFSTSSPNVPPQPSDVFLTEDLFEATNTFFGAQLGLRARGDWGAWFASGVAKVAIGAMVQTVDIEGTLITNDFNDFGTPITYPASGWFALPTNFGRRTRSVLAVVPEAGLNVGYWITPWMSVVAGYTFLYASDVVRAPQQLNRNINPAAFAISPTVPAPPVEPAFRFKSSDFWAQGLNVGIALRF